MKSSDLVRMANQIADYFAPYPKTEALDGIAKHIKNSWEPRMRSDLKAHIDAGGDGLAPLFLEAMSDFYKGAKSPGPALNAPQPKAMATGA